MEEKGSLEAQLKHAIMTNQATNDVGGQTVANHSLDELLGKVQEVIAILAPLSPWEQRRVIQALMVMIGG